MSTYLQDKSHILSAWTEKERSVGNSSVLGARFEPKPPHRLLCLRGLSQSIQIPDHYFKTSHNRLLLHPFLLILHNHIIQRYTAWRIDTIIK